jgi:small-conductance mechanosensitive channel
MIDGDALVVKEFGLMSTVFERVDGQCMIMPNSILSTSKHILNIRRSGHMWETTNIQIGFDTPLELISELRAKLRAFVNENSRDWAGGLGV